MNFMTMEYFMAVAAKRNITKAAQELHVTQQTLSAHIAALEKELDSQLFVRSSPLELTYAGEVFLRYATRIYEDYQSMWNEFNDLTNNQRGKLLVGINYTRSHALMPGIISAFQKAYPKIEVRLTEGTNESLRKGLLNKDLDLAIARFPSAFPGIETLDFYQEEIVMLVPEVLLGEEGRRGGSYIENLSAFRDYPFVLGSPYDISGQTGRSLIARAGFQPVIKAQSKNVETLLSLCAGGVGICFCPESLIYAALTEEQLKKVRMFHFITEATYPVRFGYRKESYQWKIILEFIRIAQKELVLERGPADQ